MKKLEDRTIEGMAKGLGWFSIGLGLTQIIAPRALARLIGIKHVEKTATLMRVCGAREIGAGIGILTGRRTKGTWARVAGDAVDLALLGLAISDDENDRIPLAIATAAVAGVTALDVITAQQLTVADRRVADRPSRSVVIDLPVDEVAELWKDYQSAPGVELDAEALAGVVRCVPCEKMTKSEIHLEHTEALGERAAAQLDRFKQWVQLGRLVQLDSMGLQSQSAKEIE